MGTHTGRSRISGRHARRRRNRAARDPKNAPGPGRRRQLIILSVARCFQISGRLPRGFARASAEPTRDRRNNDRYATRSVYAHNNNNDDDDDDDDGK